MNKKMTIKEKISYLKEVDSLINILNNELTIAEEQKDEQLQKVKEFPEDEWFGWQLKDTVIKITVVNKLIDDLEELAK